MTRPGTVQTTPTLATNDNYGAGANSWHTTPTKVAPDLIAATGFTPAHRPPAQWMNWLFWYLLGHAAYLDGVDLLNLTDLVATEQDGTTDLENCDTALYSAAVLEWDPIKKVWWYASGPAGTTGELYYSNNLKHWFTEAANIPVSGSGVVDVSGIAVNQTTGNRIAHQATQQGADAGTKYHGYDVGTGLWSGFISTTHTASIRDVQWDAYGGSNAFWMGGATTAPVPTLSQHPNASGGGSSAHTLTGPVATTPIRQIVCCHFGILATQFGANSGTWFKAGPAPYSGAFTKVGGGIPTTNIDGMAYDPIARKAYVITSAGLVYYSTNGTVWTQVANLQTLLPYPGTMDPKAGTLEAYGGCLAVSIDSGSVDPERTILVSRDHGLTWVSIGHPFRDVREVGNIRYKGGRWIVVSESGDIAAGLRTW